MKKKHISRAIILMTLIGLLLQAGFSVYSMIDERGFFKNDPITLLRDQSLSPEVVEGIEVSQEVQGIIKAQYAQRYSHYLNLYKYFLTTLNVSPSLQFQVEALLKEGYLLGDIMTGYDFLYHSYGTVDELKSLLRAQQRGQIWTALFKEYNQNNSFVPRAFDSEYLERLTETPGITSDDIMIADRISQKSGTDFEALIHRLQEGESWRQITEALAILNGSDSLPRVQVTQEKLTSYASLGLTEDRIVEALVLANKLGFSEEAVLDLARSGKGEEDILAAGYQEKYQ